MAENVIVSAYLELKDKLSPGMSSAARAVSGMTDQVERGKQSLQDMRGVASEVQGTLLSMAASVGVSFGAMELAKSFIEANAETERAHKQLAGFLASTYEFSEDPLANFNTGLRTATNLMAALDEAEAEIGIDKSEMLPMAQALAPAFAQAGMAVEDLGGFVADVAGKASALGMDLDALSMNLTKAISEGRVGPGLKRLGLTAKEFKNAKTEVARLELITKKLKLIPDTELRKIQTWDDLMRRIKITVDGILEDGGKSFFESAKESAEKILKYLTENKEMLQTVVRDVGEKFVFLLDKSVKATTYIIKHFDQIFGLVKSIGLAIVGWKTASALVGMGTTLGTAAAAIGPAAAGFGAQAAAAFSSAAAVVGAGVIGYAIGDALRQYLETTDWWRNMWDAIGETFSSSIREQQAEAKRMEQALAQYQPIVTKYLMGMKAQSKEEQAQALIYAMKQRAVQTSYYGEYSETQLIAEWAKRNLGIDVKTYKPASAADKAKAAAPQVNFNNNRFDITQKFAEGFDPDRVAVAFAQDLGRMGEMRMQSALAPTAGLVR